MNIFLAVSITLNLPAVVESYKDFFTPRRN